MILCRNCESWRDSRQWWGNCEKHPWEQEKATEDTSPNQDCQGKDFKDKYIKYQLEKEESCRQ